MTTTVQTQDVSRRTAMKITGKVGVAGLAVLSGCSGTGGNGSDGDDSSNHNISEQFPSEDIELTIPYGPGGGYDQYVRLLAPYLSEAMGVEVIVQNVEGAGGQVGMSEVYNGDPDGYRHIVVNPFMMSLTQFNEDVEYDLTDMSYFARISVTPNGVCVGTNTEIKSWDDYVEAVSAGELNFYTPGPGDSGVATQSLLGNVTGAYETSNVLDNLVVYDGRGDGIQGILSGDVQAMGGSIDSLMPYMESDDLRLILLCTMDEEVPDKYDSPDADTLVSAGIDDAVEPHIDLFTHPRLFGGAPEIADKRINVLRDGYNGAITNRDFVSEAEESDRPVSYADGETAAEIASSMLAGWEENAEIAERIWT